MSLLHALGIFAAGAAAGTINVIVGSGTLITFPTLIAFGYAPVVANVSNTIGLVPGSAAGAVGYRRELRGQGSRVRKLSAATLLGAAAGATLLLTLPASAFKAIVPAFIALALVLIIVQPRLGALLRRHRGHAHERIGAATLLGVCATGVYAGYFGAAQGILMLAILGLSFDDDLHRLNATKNVLAAMANLLAGVIFAIAAHVDWAVVALIVPGAIIGGTLGARYGRRLPPAPLRALIVAVGIVAIVRLL
ncbi:MAG TPA: sulfite exporter TauE/SafE family protein [Solirubrobacteraceae bacterium]|nr:sulfite exporter TauE/SafE family protein [Solirubrobacteraceae bacterium]